MKKLLSRMFRQVVTLFCFSLSSFGCSYFAPVYTVPPSFSVRVKNDVGLVSGLKLRVVRFKAEQFEKLDAVQQRFADPKRFIEVVAESVTDVNGMAQFNIARTGRFTLEPRHEASQLDWVDLDVVADAKPIGVEMKWPTSHILRTKIFAGRISDGLMSSRESPLKYRALSIRTLIAYDEVANGMTNDNGSFGFKNIPNGLYFLRVILEDGNYGNIVVFIGDSSTPDALSISTIYTSCGFLYDLTENKSHYAPVACFKGGKQVPCAY